MVAHNALETRFGGKPLSSLVILEIFVGSARLSKACNGAGITSIAVDKTKSLIFRFSMRPANDLSKQYCDREINLIPIFAPWKYPSKLR